MKKVKLGEIAKLNVGLVLSRYGEKSKELGHAHNGLADKAIYKSVTLRAISDDGMLNISECDTFEVTEKIPFQYFTQKDDILMRSFSPIKVGLVAKEQENLIVPSQFAIIRVDSEQILVEYLLMDAMNMVSVIRSSFPLTSRTVNFWMRQRKLRLLSYIVERLL